MKLREMFDTCATSRGYYQNHGVDYKLDSGVLFFRQSKEPIDWVRNILAIIPVDSKAGQVARCTVGGVACISARPVPSPC